MDETSLAAKLVEQFGGASLPASVVEAAFARHHLTVPNLPYVRTGPRGGRVDLSSLLCPSAPAIAAVVSSDDVFVSDDGRFAALDLMTHGLIDGHYRALIVSGNPGIGKTYTLESILNDAVQKRKIKKLSIVHGFTRATGLYRLLYEHRFPGNIILFDDCDSVFGDETALNLLKASLDTTHKRIVGWHSEKPFKDEDGVVLPKSFEFEGTIVFVSNIDFDKALTTKLGPHIEALMSRSYYLDLNMRNEQELIARIDEVTRRSTLLAEVGLGVECADLLLYYIKEKRATLREISLRAVVKLAHILRAAKSSDDFLTMAKAATCKAQPK